MLGLWLKRSPIPVEERENLITQFFPLYKSLIETDNRNFEFGSDIMFTGLYGTSMKTKNVELNSSVKALCEKDYNEKIR